VNTKKLTLYVVRAGVFAALIFVTTAFTAVQIWPGGGGYIHAGDAVIFVACVYLGWAAVPAAAAGSMLADLVVPGAAVYSIPTFIIKGLMAAIAVGVIKLFQKCGAKGQTANDKGQEANDDGEQNVNNTNTSQFTIHNSQFPPILLMLLAFTAASLFMQTAYAFADYILYGVIGIAEGGVYAFAFIEFAKGFIQSAVGIPAGIVIARLLKFVPVWENDK